MTATEFSYEFDALWDNIFSGNAPSINPYEKSVFLTQAQKMFVEEMYKILDTSEWVISQLSGLIKNAIVEEAGFITDYDSNVSILNTNSKLAQLEPDVWFLTQERVETTEPKSVIKVIPITNDQFSTFSTNPFRIPNKRHCWRIDTNNITQSGEHEENSYNNSQRYVELVYDTSINYTTFVYKYRYIKYPVPIILEDLDGDDSQYETGVTIDGMYKQTDCELDSHSAQLKILNLAVKLAEKVYKGN